MSLLYQDDLCVLASMHRKEEVVAPIFKNYLGCIVIAGQINTDLLGTFTGEVERKYTPLECAREKCRLALAHENGNLGLASEGSFVPHPLIPWAASDQELLYFTDKKRGFELTVTSVSCETNYDSKIIENLDELIVFAKKCLFPTHGLIMRANKINSKPNIYKGIRNPEVLLELFSRCSKESIDGMVRVETDMRAHMNPTRMKVIAGLAQKMAQRLATACPVCQTPGWGVVRKESGLECRDCCAPTLLAKFEIFGCCKCGHEERLQINGDGADPRNCSLCNP